MSQETGRCDHERLRLSLEDQLIEVEQAELADHLEECVACRQELERLAAASRYWGAARSLQAGDQDEAAAGRCLTVGLKAGEDDDEAADSEAGSAWLRLLEPPDPERDRPGMLGRVGLYEVMEVLGQGGMGVVLKARDPSLDRTVAIKLLNPALAHGATARRRFAREAKAAAAVGHEHIVAIHAVDEFRGLPYLVMQYIPGRSLQDRLDDLGPLEVREILRIGTQAARALAAAHAQGVVHRDIKPANILLENCVERVKLTDFGLARAVDDASLTQSGIIAGTPQYMAPEQARGEPVDARSDLFSLGAVLYAMAAGRPPFRADSAMAVLKRVCDDRHRPIRELNPDIPDWLEMIIDRLLAKDPADRFASAADVAELLERGLAHLQQPLAVARPAVDDASAPALEFHLPAAKSPATSIRPHRRALAAAAACLVGLVGLGASEAAGLSNVSEFVATILRIKTPEGTLVLKVDDPGVKVDVDHDVVVIGGAGPQEIRLHTGPHRLLATRNGQPVRDELVSITRGEKQVVTIGLEPSPSPVAASGPAEGISSLEFESSADAREGLDWIHRRGLVWSLAFTPDGRRLAIGQQAIVGGVSPLRVWDLKTRSDVTWMGHATAYRSVAVSPDGRILAGGTFDGMLEFYRLEGDLAVRLTPDYVCSPINSASFLPDSHTVVLGTWEGDVRYAASPPALERRLQNYPGRVYGVAASPDGSLIAVAGEKGVIELHDVSTGRLRATLTGHELAVESVAFSPDGNLLASGGWDHTVRLWDAQSGKLLTVLRGLDRQVLCVTFSPDGKLLAASEGQSEVPHTSILPCKIKLWDVASKAEVRSLDAHSNSIHALAFSPDGKTLASGSMDQTVKFWDVAAGTLRETIVPGETGANSGMGIASMARTMASTSAPANLPAASDSAAPPASSTERPGVASPGAVVALLQPEMVLPLGGKVEAWAVAYSPDGKTLVTSGSGGTLLRWQVSVLPGVRQPLNGSSGANQIVFAPDGKLFATSNWDHTVGLFSAEGEQLTVLKGHDDGVRSVAFSPDGKLLASGSWDRTTRLWDVAARKEIRALPAQPDPINAVAFSPDGTLLAIGTGDWRTEKPGEVELWDPATGKHLGNAWHSPREVKALAFSSDGKHLAVAHAASRLPGGDGGVALVGVSPAPASTTVLSCPAGATALGFSPDGKILSAGQWDGSLRLWDPASQKALTPWLPAHKLMIFNVAFSPDGKYLATASKDGTVKIWNVEFLTESRSTGPQLRR